MKTVWNRLVSGFLAVIMLSIIIPKFAVAEDATVEQKTALAMLNHLTVLSQETNDSANSRLFMEEAYSLLINNTYPNSVDSKTLSRLTRMLDTMEKYRMINVKRERLQFIYEQNQARAIRAAIPNPLGMLSTVHSLTPARLVASVVYMAVDSYTSYESAKSEAELQYLKDGWQLDDEEAEALHQSRKDMFSYMITIVNDYKFDGDLALTEEAVKEFTRWKNETNVVARIQFLESNQKTYQAYGGYWLTLAESYYNNGELQKCIEAVKTYEGMQARIFRRDFEYAKVLPLAIAAAEQVYQPDEYVEFAAERADAIVNNTRNEDWALRYFAAQTFVSIFDKTNDESYLKKAYDITLDNANNLVPEQRNLNSTYIAKVKETETPKDATNDKKEQIKKYNTMLKEKRKTELPPVSDALLLNCDLLFSLADKIGITDTEKARVDTILHPNKEPLFLTEPLDNKYWFNLNGETAIEDIGIAYGGTQLIIPVSFITDNVSISVQINDSVLLDDWKLEKVERQTEGDITTYGAVFTSAKAHDHPWVEGEQIKITVSPDTENEIPAYHFEYTTEGSKQNWYDWLVPWQGQKNNWYDYLKVWDNSVNFIRVK